MLGPPPRPSDGFRTMGCSSPCASYPVCEIVMWAPEEILIQKSSSPLCLRGVSLPYSKPHCSLSLLLAPQGHPSHTLGHHIPCSVRHLLSSALEVLRRGMNEPTDVSAEPQFSPPCRAGCSDYSDSLQLPSAPPLTSNAPSEQFPTTVAGCRLSAHVRSTVTATSLSRIEAE